jgi:alpha-1,3-rhamnosyl/mannosyltransferase
LPEVAGGAAIYVDPTDPTDLARAMVRLIEAPSLAAELSALGIERAKGFSWLASAAAMDRIFAECG